MDGASVCGWWERLKGFFVESGEGGNALNVLWVFEIVAVAKAWSEQECRVGDGGRHIALELCVEDLIVFAADDEGGGGELW